MIRKKPFSIKSNNNIFTFPFLNSVKTQSNMKKKKKRKELILKIT